MRRSKNRLMHSGGPLRSPLIPDYGHLKGHYPAYTMVTCQRKEIKTINLYFHAFYNQNIKFFTSHNLVSLVTPEGLTNTWNNHYPPVRFLCNGNVVHSSSK